MQIAIYITWVVRINNERINPCYSRIGIWCEENSARIYGLALA